jgi:cytochrome c oxidase subunit 2
VRKGQIVRLTVIAVLVAAAATAVAVAIPWLPPAASKQRDEIDVTYWLVTGISIFICAVVVATIVYSIVKFRAREDDDTDGPPIHGHTGLEIFWTAVPAVLVTVIAVVSAVVLTDISDAGSDPMRVDVTATQFAWSFEYRSGPAKGAVEPVLRLPVDRTVQLQLRSKDVIHSFWVPAFGQKIDALPFAAQSLHPTKLVLTPTKVGTFPVICTELCGLGHSLMRSQAIVMPPSSFTAWAEKAAKGAS